MATVARFLQDDRRAMAAVAVLAGASRIAHLLAWSLGSLSSLYYWPVLAARRFESAALAIVSGDQVAGPFVYASPLYRFLILPFYLAGTGRTGLFVVQSLAGIVTACLILRMARRLGVPPLPSFLTAAVWILYAPAVFFELTVLPVTVLTLLTTVFVCLGAGDRIDTAGGALAAGLIVAVLAGLRPPMIILGAWPLARWIRRKSVRLVVPAAVAFLLPMLMLAWMQHSSGGGFSPFPRSAGLNLVLGHSDGVTGYGPPVEALGLVETSTEDIHQVAARIAAENGMTDPAEADAWWMGQAIRWAAGHPSDELRLLMVKLGGFLGHRPFDTYYDMGRLGRFSSALVAHPVPRLIPVLLFLAGLFHFLSSRDGRRLLLILPVAVSAGTCLLFVHCERFTLPVLPCMLLVGAAGLCRAFPLQAGRRIRGAALSLAGLVLFVPALLWPVPSVPEGMYVYRLGVSAFEMGDYDRALEMFERSAATAPEGSVVGVESHRHAALILEASGQYDRAAVHRRMIEEYTGGT